MSPEMNWNNVHIGHGKPVSSFDVSKDDEMGEAFNWKDIQLLFEKVNLRKSRKFNFIDHRLKFY